MGIFEYEIDAGGRPMKRLTVAILLISVVAAGCSGQQRTSVGTEQTTEDIPEISTEGAPFPVETGAVFHRVETLLGTELPVPEIRILKVSRDNRTHVLSTDAFSRRMGIVRRQSMNEVGGNTHRGLVRIFYTDDATTGKMEQVLAHEFVHVGQPDAIDQEMSTKQGSHSSSTDAKLVREAVKEGTVVYVTNEYTAEYLANTTSQALYPEWNTFAAGTKWHLAPYYFGAKYVEKRIDGTRNAVTVYENPPVTSEQLLHGYKPKDEPPENLTVRIDTKSSSAKQVERDTKGELFVRIVLAEHVPTSLASDAATGWGNDRLVTVRDREQTLHAWALRWDDERNATEFENAIHTYLKTGRLSEAITGQMETSASTFGGLMRRLWSCWLERLR